MFLLSVLTVTVFMPFCVLEVCIGGGVGASRLGPKCNPFGKEDRHDGARGLDRSVIFFSPIRWSKPIGQAIGKAYSSHTCSRQITLNTTYMPPILICQCVAAHRTLP